MPEPGDGPESITLIEGVAGIQREKATFLLEPSESPSSIDTDLSSDQEGLLGPRGGRSKVLAAYDRIMGVGSFAFPTGRWRVLCTNDGIWRASAVTWP